MCMYGTTENVWRGDIYYADLGPGRGSEQGGERPVLVIQNNTGNQYSPTVIIAAITSKKDKTRLPTHVRLRAHQGNLPVDSIVLLEQVKTFDKAYLGTKIGHLTEDEMAPVDRALRVSVGV